MSFQIFLIPPDFLLRLYTRDKIAFAASHAEREKFKILECALSLSHDLLRISEYTSMISSHGGFRKWGRSSRGVE